MIIILNILRGITRITEKIYQNGGEMLNVRKLKF